MADRPSPGVRPVTRAQLSSVSGDHEVIKLLENLPKLSGVVESHATDIEGAIAAAAAAQVAADAAQANVDAIEGAAFVLISADADLPNHRTLAVDAKALKLTDGGAGNPATLASADLIAILPGDVADSSAAFVNATGLVFAALASATYMVEALLTFTAAATTTGLALTLTVPAGASLSGMYAHNTSASALQGSYNNAGGAVGGNTTDSATAAGNMAILARWIVKTAGTAGNVQLQFRTEVAASSITLKAGVSALIARRIA